MPLYDYRCTACGNEVEVMHGIDGVGPERCEACGGPMRKALSAPAIHFKGSGWAKVDARAKATTGAKKADDADGEGSPSKDGKDSASSDGSGSKGGAATSTKADGGTKAEGASGSTTPAGSGSGTASGSTSTSPSSE